MVDGTSECERKKCEEKLKFKGKVVLKKLLKNFHKLFTNFQSIFNQNEYDVELFDKFWIIMMYHNIYLRIKLLEKT